MGIKDRFDIYKRNIALFKENKKKADQGDNVIKLRHWSVDGFFRDRV